ncbi:balbiani ring protein 3-like [Eriocheir sinensis]|uniref:balbiani ring protein 3-like n=1 Tax=Eriocheir sinensis TaxID=95602 RepID=UPI0021C7C04F|nr:balbiani ring protein 3-like [Eriocheir sinensis]XP_050726796.1 balbiani ring protein 3-like [Eriocheir sinensis]
MVMKIVLMMAVVMVLGHVTGQKCVNSLEYIQLSKITKCANPKSILVQLPVPEGFDYVTPSVVILPQCKGLSCSDFPEQCLPKSGQIKNHTYEVYARSRNGTQPVCAKVTVQEHLACECRCDERACPGNWVFNFHTCKCECANDLEEECKTRQNKGYGVMWSPRMCSCKCDTDEECDTGKKWNRNKCECAAIN